MENYIKAVRRAGGEPVPGYAPAPEAGCLGLLLCGGGDVDPARFGQEDRGSHPPDLVRDGAEWELLRAYLAAGKPVLGVCRGLQVLNVYLGGTLHQDLGRAGNALHQGEEDVFHPLRTAPGSRLAAWFGENPTVNSAHHQGADRLGEGLRPTAWAPDGTVEGLEHTSLPVVGVQFHPERLPAGPEQAGGEALFRWLVEESRRQSEE